MRYHRENDKLLEPEQRRIAKAGGRSFTARRRIARALQPIDEISQGARGLMSDRMEFDIVCPNNHNQTVAFSREEFEEALKSGVLVFHCNTCDADWPPSTEEIAKLRKQFPKNLS